MGKKVSEGRGKKKRRLVICLVAVFAVIIAAVCGVFAAVKFMPSGTVADLEAYYKLTDAADDEIAIILRDLPLSGEADDEERDRIGTVILDERAFIYDGTAYVSADVIKEYIDDRFYYDDTDGCIVVTNAQEMITAYEEETFYTVNGEETIDMGSAILIVKDGTAYISMDFADAFSCAYYSIYEDPGRLVIDYISDDVTYCEVTKDTKIRQYAGIKADIIGEVYEGEILQVKRTLEGWYEVISESGYVGYVKAGAVSETYTSDEESDYDEPEYTSLSLGETVKLGWFAVYNMTANDNFYDTVESTEGINVISPTWYSLASADGDIDMISSRTVVNLAHAMGYQVWVLFADTDYEYIQALSSTATRQKIIETVLEDVISKGIDGINIDFEHITSEYGEDFIEFIRELSIRCREEGLYLSIDNYAPYDSRDYYYIEEQSTLCDYVIIMAYDDYVGTGEQGPNSSLSFVAEVTEIAIEKVDTDKLVIALPFYCRFWTEESDGSYAAKTYFMTTAWNRLSEVGAEAVWDEELGLYTAVYTNADGNTVYAYLESSETLEAKLSLLESYSLAGAAFWRLGQESDEVWDVIAGY